MNRYVFEFTGTITPKNSDPYTERFFAVAVKEEDALNILKRSNAQVPDLTYAGNSYKCNEDWDV